MRFFLLSLALALAGMVVPIAAQTTPLAVVTAADGASDDFFGYDLAVDGDWAVVGAYGDDRDNPVGGAAYVFERTAGGWVERQKLISPGLGYGEFGASVDLDGDRLIVGHIVGLFAPGAAYVYARTAQTWTLEAELTGDRPGGDAAGDFFGSDVALDGDRALVGASQEGSGAAYAFHRGASGWVRETRFGSAVGPGLHVGWSVALDGDRAVVGGANQVGVYARTEACGLRPPC